MHAMRIVGILFLLLMAGCAGVKPAAPAAPPQAAAPKAATQAVGPVGTSAETQSPPATPSTGQSAARAAEPSAKAPAKAALARPPVSAAQTPKKESIAPDIGKQQAPALDLASLEQRLKDTKAIGVLTKITLKNQIDDLLDQFRAFYQGKLKTTLADLRRSYDLLVLKVLSLLQDSDPTLAGAIATSREAIWGILSDRAKFATI